MTPKVNWSESLLPWNWTSGHLCTIWMSQANLGLYSNIVVSPLWLLPSFPKSSPSTAPYISYRAIYLKSLSHHFSYPSLRFYSKIYSLYQYHSLINSKGNQMSTLYPLQPNHFMFSKKYLYWFFCQSSAYF